MTHFFFFNKKIELSKLFFCIALLLIFIYLFIQNFIFSESLDIIQLRSVDDLAFNISLRKWHEALSSLNFKQIINMNDYGYGWIFWALYGLITFPFFLLGNETLLISSARNLSLFYSFGTLFFTYKILSKYTKSFFYKAFIILFILSIRSFIYWGTLCFDTSAQIIFFSMLSVYFIINDSKLSRKTILLSALSASIAVATKLTGIFVLILLFFLIFDRLKWKINANSLKKIFLYIVVFFSSFVLFANPAFFFFPFFRTEIDHFFVVMKYYMKQSSTMLENHGTQNFLFFFRKGVASYSFGIYGIIIFFLLYIKKIFHNLKEKKYDFLYLFITILIATIYLLFRVQHGAAYVAKYSIFLVMLLPFSLLSLEKNSQGKKITLIVAIVISFHHFLSPPRKNFNFTTFYQAKISKKVLIKQNLMKSLKKIIPYSKGKKITALVNHNGIFPYSAFRKGIKLIYSFENYAQLPVLNYNYILLFKKSTVFLSEKELAKRRNKEMLLKSKKIIMDLINNNHYLNRKYRLIYDKDEFLLYKSMEK